MGVAAYIAATLGLLALFGIVWTLIGRPVLRLILGGSRPQGAEGFLLTLATAWPGAWCCWPCWASSACSTGLPWPPSSPWRCWRTVEPRRVVDQFDENDRLRTYQLHLHQAYYYLGRDVLGGWVGPARYRDLVALGGNGSAVAAHLAALGRNALLVDVSAIGDGFPLTGSFLDHFGPCGRDGRAALFVRRDALPEDAGNWPPAACRDAAERHEARRDRHPQRSRTKSHNAQ